MPNAPLLSSHATLLLERILQMSSSVLEFGAGYSTAWIEQRCTWLTSVETDAVWFERVEKEIHDSRATELVLTLDPVEFYRSLGDVDVDVTIIDCAERFRVPLIEHAAKIVKPGQWLVVDDYFFKHVRALVDDKRQFSLAQWDIEILHGRKHRPHGENIPSATAFMFRQED